jgi:hypothetical protein
MIIGITPLISSAPLIAANGIILSADEPKNGSETAQPLKLSRSGCSPSPAALASTRPLTEAAQ